MRGALGVRRDLVVTKRDGKVIFDKRDEGTFDLLTVSETAQDAITDDKENINGVPQLSRESTAANHAYAQQVLGNEPPVRLGEPDEAAPGDAGARGVQVPQVAPERRRDAGGAVRTERRDGDEGRERHAVRQGAHRV